MIKWLKKLCKSNPVVENSNPVNLEFKVWEHFTPAELSRIAQMLGYHAYGSIELNMNDTFGYACAWGVEVDQFDLVAVSELFAEFGPGGVVAWCAVKEGVEKPIRHYPNFNQAKRKIEGNLLYYYWDKRIKLKGGNP